MSSKIVVFFCLLFQISFGQIKARIPLHAQIVIDSVQVNGGNALNVNSKAATFISEDGFFDILAKAKDTIVLHGAAFKTRIWIVRDEDFMTPMLTIKAEAAINQLKEVVVSKVYKPKLDMQRIVDTPYFDDEKSSPINRTMPSYTIENGMDFVKIGKMFANWFNKTSKNKEIDFYENFSEAAFKSVPPGFFTKTLLLEESQVGLFMIFCENDPQSKTFLKRESKFELTDFLITKSKEFRKSITLEK